MDFFSFVIIVPALLVLALCLVMLASTNKNIHLIAILAPLVFGCLMLSVFFWGPVYEGELYRTLMLVLFMQACALGIASGVLMFFHFVVRRVWRFTFKRAPA